MSNVTTTSKVTINSILGTVQTLAQSTQRTIHTATSGLDMIDTYVASARQRQADRTKIAMANYRENLLLESSADQAEFKKTIHERVNKDAVTAQLFDEEFKRLSRLFDQP